MEQIENKYNNKILQLNKSIITLSGPKLKDSIIKQYPSISFLQNRI